MSADRDPRDANVSRLIIGNARLRAEILPEYGASLARFDYVGRGRPEPVFRPWHGDGTPVFSDLANMVLVPWSNRITGGGFTFDGRFHPLAPNLAQIGEPVHGNGFQSGWSIADHRGEEARLALVSDGPGPFHYTAEMSYRIDGPALIMRLTVTNTTKERSLPFGFGFHPWLPRTPGTLFRARTKAVWSFDESKLPVAREPIAARADRDYSAARLIEQGAMLQAHDGWDGSATVDWHDRGSCLEIDADPVLDRLVLFSPAEAADFFCVEPVSHAVDAHNLPGGPEAHGLIVLDPGQSLSGATSFKLRELPGS